MDEPEIFDEGRIYSGRNGSGPRPGSCCASVYGQTFSHQCGNKTKVKRLVQRRSTFFNDEVGTPVLREYCGTHDPLKVKQRDDARRVIQDEKHALRKASQDRAEALYNYRAACVAAIEQIANGHNDARGLAMEIMKGKPE